RIYRFYFFRRLRSFFSFYFFFSHVIYRYPRLLKVNFTLSASSGLTDVTTNGAGIGAGALATGWQAVRMTQTTIAAKFFQTVDIALDQLAKLSFYRIGRFQIIL